MVHQPADDRRTPRNGRQGVLCAQYRQRGSKVYGPYWFYFWRSGGKLRKRYVRLSELDDARRDVLEYAVSDALLSWCEAWMMIADAWHGQKGWRTRKFESLGRQVRWPEGRDAEAEEYLERWLAKASGSGPHRQTAP